MRFDLALFIRTVALAPSLAPGHRAEATLLMRQETAPVQKADGYSL